MTMCTGPAVAVALESAFHPAAPSEADHVLPPYETCAMPIVSACAAAQFAYAQPRADAAVPEIELGTLTPKERPSAAIPSILPTFAEPNSVRNSLTTAWPRAVSSAPAPLVCAGNVGPSSVQPSPAPAEPVNTAESTVANCSHCAYAVGEPDFCTACAACVSDMFCQPETFSSA